MYVESAAVLQMAVTIPVKFKGMSIISNGNWTEWSTVQGVIGGVILNWPSAWRKDDLKLRA